MAPTSKKDQKAKSKDGVDQVDQRLIKALGHPVRTRALAILNERIASPKEIAEELEEEIGTVSYHVKTLREYGCAELVKTEPRRGAVEHYYRATRRAMLPDEAWKLLPDAIQRDVSVGVLNETFDDVAKSLKAGIFNNRDDRHLSWTPLTLDSDGWGEFTALLAETLDRAFEIQAASVARMSGSKGGERVAATMSLMGFESVRDSS